VTIDKVQPLKIEDTATGGDGVDQFPTGLDPQADHVECAGLVLDDATHRDENVRVFRAGDNLSFQDTVNTTPVTLTDLMSGSGFNETAHEHLATLTHDIDATAYYKITYTGFLISGYVAWTTSGMTQKIREWQLTYSTVYTSRVTQVVTIQYDSTGTEKMRETSVYSYLTNGMIDSVQTTKTGSP
jgi:hypothetical protein